MLGCWNEMFNIGCEDEISIKIYINDTMTLQSRVYTPLFSKPSSIQ